MLEIKNLTASIGDNIILQDFNLNIEDGKVHAIMGPNGSGKSTLSNVIIGNPNYNVKEGEILFKGVNILELDINERALLGLFLCFQYPTEIPGLSVANFLKYALNSKLKNEGKPELTSVDFLRKVKPIAKELGVSDEMLKRYVNVGFSGGEKKRIEILQMKTLEPSLAILDEMDSGLDIDALKLLSQTVNTMRAENRSFLVITHYQRLLDYITPDIIHIMVKGKIVETGDASLALKLEQKGYSDFR